MMMLVALVIMGLSKGLVGEVVYRPVSIVLRSGRVSSFGPVDRSVYVDRGWYDVTTTKRTLKECPRLSIPYYGMAVCRNVDLDLHFDYTPRNRTFMANYGGQTAERFTEAMPIDTECSFKCGPGFYLKGSQTRNCLPLSKWDGLQTQCKQILCPALPSVPYAKYEPTDCAVSKSAFGTNCTIICDSGFEMRGGPPTKQCGGRRTGVWSHGRGSKTIRCLDVSPPYMECPGHYSVLMDDTYPHALIRRLQQPYVYDNSGDNYTYWSRPAIPEAGLHLTLGDHRFTYVAVDSFKNRARCSFTVSVIDQTPPEFGACRDPPVHYVSLPHNPQETFVHWEDPHVADNSGPGGLTLTKNLTQGYLPAGVHYVRYRALDPTANVAECTMRVEVRQYSCDVVPDLGTHGVAVCAHNGTHVWCELSCKDDYMFHTHTADTVTLVCERDRPTWGEPGTVSECSRVISPVGVEKVLTVRLTEELPSAVCGDSEAVEELSQTFSEGLHEQLCRDQPDCNLLTSVPACSGGADVDATDNATRYHLVGRRRHRAGTGESRSAVKVVVYQRISQKLGLWRSDGKKSENIKRIKEELQKINGNEKLRRRLGALKLDLSVLKLDELIHCPAGSVVRNLLCVQCPRGSYHKRMAAAGCVPCPAGTFNERTGQVKCQACPPFHSTTRPHAKHAHDCKAQCGPGTVARLRVVKRRRTGTSEEPRFQKILMPFCLVRCKTMGSPLNGRAVLSTNSGGGGAPTTYGAVVRFTCDAGFLLVGEAERHCRATGTWSGGPDPPVCRSVDRCPALPPADPQWLATVAYTNDHGVLRAAQSTYDVGVLAVIRCADGWVPEGGDDLLICRDGGHWDPAAPLGPRCVPRVHIWPLSSTASPPPTTPRVIRVSRRPDVPFWTLLRDYLLHGCRGAAGGDALLMFCFGWTGPNASVSTTTELPTWRDLADYQLPAAEEPMAEQLLHRLLTTAADGGPDPALRPVQLLPYILYGSVREPPAESRLATGAEDAYRFLICQYIGVIMMDRELNYDGELEVEVDGNGNTNARIKLLLRNVVRPIYQLYRQRQGQLSDGAREPTTTTTPDPGLRCELAALPPPPIDPRVLAPLGSGGGGDDDGAWLRGNRATVAAGTLVRYGCARGFSMRGTGETRCAATGHWTPVHGFCQGALCDEPRLRPLMLLPSSSASGPHYVDDELEIRCREGHVLEGHPSIRCQPNGRWTPIVAHCARVSCGPAPVRRTDPSIAGKTYHYGDSLQLGCGSGVDRAPHTTCQANGQWTPFTEC